MVAKQRAAVEHVEPRLTLNEVAYREIKRRIITLQMAPGTPFTESQLAAELGLSKTPVREALTWLKREGLVELTASSRYRVEPVTLKDVRDLFSLRLLLEGEAARLAAVEGVDAEDFQLLERLSLIGYDPADEQSIDRFLTANSQLHAAVARLGGNRRLTAALLNVLDQMERLFHLGLALTSRSEDNVQEHRDLVRAIVRGDADQARALALAHTHASQSMVIDALLCSDALLLTNVAGPLPRRHRIVLEE